MPAKRKPTKNTSKQTPATQKMTRDIVGLMLIALGIFALVGVFYPGLTGAFGMAWRDVMFGLFGVIAYVAPLIMIISGWLVMISWKARINGGKLGSVVALLTLIIALVHLIYDGAISAGAATAAYGAYISNSFRFGVEKGGGAGALGAVLSWPALLLLGRVGSLILIIAGITGCAAMLARFSLGSAGRKATYAAYGAANVAIERARLRYWSKEETAHEDEGLLRGVNGAPERNEPVEREVPPLLETAPRMRREGGWLDEPRRGNIRRLPNERIRRQRGRRKPEPEVIDLGTGARISPLREREYEPEYKPEYEPGYNPAYGQYMDNDTCVDAEQRDGYVTDAEDEYFEEPSGVPVTESVEEFIAETPTLEHGVCEEPPLFDEMGLPAHQYETEDSGELDLPVIEEAEESAVAAIQAVAAFAAEPPVQKLLPRPLPSIPPREVSPPEEDVNAQPQPYQKPQLDLLSRPVVTENADRRARREQEERAVLLIDTLKSFGIAATVVGISRGPALTRYELKPAAGVKVSRITGLADDIALNMAAAGVRIEAPIPGKAAIGIEVPNIEVSYVMLREVLTSDEFQNHPSRLAMAMGMDIAGKPVVGDLADMPHVLIAGATGSGKSICINCMVTSILYKATPEEVKLIMIDPKVVELSVYNGIPHLLIPVVTDPKKAAGALNWAVQEMESRYKKFASTNCRDLKGYNKYVRENGGEELYQLVVIVDELADLMIVASREVEEYINRLAQLARAAGIHLVIATQRPSVNVITGVIKANIPSRIAFAVASQVDSRTILDIAGAEKLLGKGDMLYDPRGASKPRRVQGCYISDGEVNRVVERIKSTNGTERYDNSIIEMLDKMNASPQEMEAQDDAGESDDLLIQAIELALDAGQVSASMLQRRYRIGYARAGRLIDEMEQRGIISGHEGSKPREVLLTREEFNRLYIQD